MSKKKLARGRDNSRPPKQQPTQTEDTVSKDKDKDPRRPRTPVDMDDPIERKIAVLRATKTTHKALMKVPQELRGEVLIEAAELIKGEPTA